MLRLAGVLATLGALALVAGVIAYWGWRWLGPDVRRSPPPPRVEPAAPAIIAAHLFGAAAPGELVGQGQPAVGGSIQPIGVFAGRDGRGEALLRVGARPPMLVRAGDQIAPGMLLRSVEPNAIVVVEAGIERRIELRPTVPPRAPPTPGEARSGVGAGRVATRAASATAGAACARLSDARSELYVLRGELLAGMIREPSAWRDLLRSQAGAVTITDSSGFAGLLGLRTGDRLERANGAALRGYEDVAANVLKPLTGSERVTVIGTRDGQSRTWVYVNAASCPG